jgi:hypothetical protein
VKREVVIRREGCVGRGGRRKEEGNRRRVSKWINWGKISKWFRDSIIISGLVLWEMGGWEKCGRGVG